MKKGTKIYETFELVTSGLDEFFSGISQPSSTLKYGYEDLMKIKSAKKRYERTRMIKTLEQQEYLKSVERGKKIFYKITTKGWKQKLKNQILSKKTKLKGNKVCLVSFDIPESSRGVRYALRQLLADAGFKQIHRSVWAGEKDLVKELKILIRALDASGWVYVYVGKKVI